MKSVSTDRLLACTTRSRSLLELPRTRVALLGVVVCLAGVACAPTDDRDRKFGTATSQNDDTSDDGRDQNDAGETAVDTKTNGSTDVNSTDADESDDPTDADESDEADDDETEADADEADDDSTDADEADDDATDANETDDSTDETTTTNSSEESTNDDSDEERDGGSSATTHEASSNTTGSSTDDTTNDTAHDSDTTEGISADTSDETTDTTDDTPDVPSDIADLVWVTGDVGTGPGLFDDARFLAADSDGNVYVAEFETEGAARVQVFDTDGEWLTQWLTEKESIVEGIAGTLDGELFVLQGGYVERYVGMTGEYLGPVSFEGSADAIAVGPDGGLVVVSNDRILVFSNDGSAAESNAAIASSPIGDSIFIDGAAVDGSGNIFVIDTFEAPVFKFASDGDFVTQLGIEGEGPGFLEEGPDAVTTDRYGRIFVADWDGIEVFEPGGGFAGFIDLTGAIFGMTTTIDDELFVLERNYGQLYKLKLEQ